MCMKYGPTAAKYRGCICYLVCSVCICLSWCSVKCKH